MCVFAQNRINGINSAVQNWNYVHNILWAGTFFYFEIQIVRTKGSFLAISVLIKVIAICWLPCDHDDNDDDDFTYATTPQMDNNNAVHKYMAENSMHGKMVSCTHTLTRCACMYSDIHFNYFLSVFPTGFYTHFLFAIRTVEERGRESHQH